MTFINFKSHYNVAINPVEKLNDRKWALRSCFYAVANSISDVIDMNELMKSIAAKCNSTIENKGSKILISSNIIQVSELLLKLKNAIIIKRNIYGAERKWLKKSNKRFPVNKFCINRNEVIEIINRI